MDKQFERACACPFCGASANEAFIYEEDGNVKWDGHCTDCQSDWEYFEDKSGRQHEFGEE